MTKETIKQAAENFGNYELLHLLSTLETELLADMQAGVQGNTAHLGKLEMLQVIGEVLASRNALMTPPPFVEVWYEDGYKLQRGIRVY